MGIDYNTFLKLNPTKLESFVKAEKLKQEIKDNNAWLEGYYNYIAFSSVLSNFSAGLSGKRGDAEYIDKPLHEKNAEFVKQQEDMQNQELMRKRTIDFLNNMAIANGMEKIRNEG